MEEFTSNPGLIEKCKIECLYFAHKGWSIVPSSSRRSWMEPTNGHAYKCLPLAIANQMGWVILSPTDFTVEWDGGEGLAATKVTAEDENFAKNCSSHFGHGIVTFILPYLFKTNNNIALMIRGATNFWIDGAQALDGLVETYWSNYSFTMNWKILQKNKPVLFKKGDPICMIIPYPIRLLENMDVVYKSITTEPEINEAHSKWGAYRRAFNADPNRGDKWQKDYFIGKKCPFSPKTEENTADPHITKLNLKRFDEFRQ